jgi:sulfur relay (sulfurtransferase) complex TusBCD TusD component (DsrE family)
MKIAILLKSSPGTDEAERMLQTAADLLTQGHSVHLYLLQDAVRFCIEFGTKPEPLGLPRLMEQGLAIHVLTRDAELRGLAESAAGSKIQPGSYESLVDLMESCDRVIGLL